jgi:hypothetical protein
VRPAPGCRCATSTPQPGGDWFAPVAVAALLFTGALAALLLHREVLFWVLAVLAIGWQLARLERDARRGRDDPPRPP